MAQKPSPPVETVAIDRLYCSPTNPRRNEPAIPHVAASLRRFGWQQPIVARRSGEVVAGNTRLKAAQSLGMTEVPVWWFDGDDLAATAYQIADNRTHEFAEWNDAELAALLQQLKAEDALDGVGYTEEDIDALVQELRDQEEVDKDLDDDGPDEPPTVAAAKLGDLWHLGEHRLPPAIAVRCRCRATGRHAIETLGRKHINLQRQASPHFLRTCSVITSRRAGGPPPCICDCG